LFGDHLATEVSLTHNTHTGENMSNPFELRFKLLEMAQSYLADQQAKNVDFAWQAWDHAKAQGEANIDYFKELQPDSYSIEDIKKKASELYEFVEKK